MEWVDWVRIRADYERVVREIGDLEASRACEPTIVYRTWTDEDGRHHYEPVDRSAEIASKYDRLLLPLYEQRRELEEQLRSTRDKVLREINRKIAEIESELSSLQNRIFDLRDRENDLRDAIRAFPSWREVPVLPPRDVLGEELNRVIAERKKLEALRYDLPKREGLEMWYHRAKDVADWR